MFRPVYRVDECIENIRDCLEKGWTGKGYKTIEFEEEWKKYTGLPNAHFLTTGTAALNLAVETLKEENGWEDGDEIISTPLTFVATNNCILFANLKPVFADVDDTLCLDPVDVERKITSKTRAVIFVGLGGNSGRLEEVIKVCKKHNLRLILDAAHMAGTRVNGAFPGVDADAVIFSFHVTKNLSTAESGMLCFKDERLDQIIRNKSFNGISKNEANTDKRLGGYNVKYLADAYNGNSIMASIAIAQLKSLDEENAIRRHICKEYDDAFCINPNIKLVKMGDGCESARWLYQIIVDNRDSLLSHLQHNGIDCGIHYPINTLYHMYDNQYGKCPRAEWYSEHILTLPLHILLTEDEINYIINTVTGFLK